MKKQILLLSVFMFGTLFFAHAQSKSYENIISFGQAQKIGEVQYASPTYQYQKTDAFSLAFISAYAEKEHAAMQLSYQIEVNGKLSEMHYFETDNEGITPGRTVFVAQDILKNFSSIRFFSDIESETPIHFRIFLAEKSNPKIIERNIVKNILTACSCAQPNYCDRLCWCTTCPPGVNPTYTTPTHIIVHHSAGNTQSTDYAAVVASYWDYHVNTKGWDDIGYNWLIDPNGIIYEGRGNSVRGAHFSCMNNGTTGICLVGNYETTEPFAPAITALTELIAWECCDKNIDPTGISFHANSQLNLNNISGHRDGNPSPSSSSCASGTLCPGQLLYDRLPQIRQSVATFSCLSGIKNLQESNFSISPNPSTGIFILKSTTYSINPKNIEIRNLLGEPINISAVQTNTFEIKIDLTKQSVGTYFLIIKTQEGEYLQKLMKY